MTIETRIFHISSQSADNYNNGAMLSDMSFTIPHFISSTSNVKNIYFSILKCECPNSFYLINQYNNILVLEVDAVESSYTLEYGNYNVNTFITALRALLGSNYTITYNNITGKFQVSSPFNFTIKSNTTIYRFLGLQENMNIPSILGSGTYTLTSSYVVNFLPQQIIHFRNSDLKLDSYNAYDKSNDIFLSIQNTAPLGSSIFYNNFSNLRYSLDIEELSNFQIRITDDKNRLLDFNNINWYMAIQIDYEYFETPLKGNLTRFFKENRKDYVLEYLKSLQKNIDEDLEREELDELDE